MPAESTNAQLASLIQRLEGALAKLDLEEAELSVRMRSLERRRAEVASLVVIAQRLREGAGQPQSVRAPRAHKPAPAPAPTPANRTPDVRGLGIVDAARLLAAHYGEHAVSAGRLQQWLEDAKFKSRLGSIPTRASVYTALTNAVQAGEIQRAPQRGRFQLVAEG